MCYHGKQRENMCYHGKKSDDICSHGKTTDSMCHHGKKRQAESALIKKKTNSICISISWKNGQIVCAIMKKDRENVLSWKKDR